MLRPPMLTPNLFRKGHHALDRISFLSRSSRDEASILSDLGAISFKRDADMEYCSCT